MNIAVIGSRKYAVPEQIIAYVNELSPDDTLVSGGAPGADRIAEKAALARGMKVNIIPADWDRYGKGAGFIRNKDIIRAADRVVAFWDGSSRGTLNSIEHAKRNGKRILIFLCIPEGQLE